MNLYLSVVNSMCHDDPYNSLNENMYGSVHEILYRKSTLWKNKVFVLAGKYQHFNIQAIIKNNSGTIQSKLNSNAHYLVVPHHSEQKLKKVEYFKRNKSKLGCKLITDVEIIRRLHRYWIK